MKCTQFPDNTFGRAAGTAPEREGNIPRDGGNASACTARPRITAASRARADRGIWKQGEVSSPARHGHTQTGPRHGDNSTAAGEPGSPGSASPQAPAARGGARPKSAPHWGGGKKRLMNRFNSSWKVNCHALMTAVSSSETPPLSELNRKHSRNVRLDRRP